ncbi:XRE family transcriptional regulator [Solwaraspora sp. WMMD1047]|uniref:XRE family transcriptional regulator n=1 Tax=Solwaraspora sp. WMMD1047 TaxID=3016102 RepID=UPI002416C304|nr:XRE family transcriptional regulator [Solwaraspora sp. WMMD1047]MDG4834621.1 XRE family transcriptional regulator [Solwaraspora sp. WMMD1047]
MLRNWKRWESGEVEPDDFYKPLIAAVFGIATGTLFPRRSTPGQDAELISRVGMDTLEILARLRASDASTGTIEALEITADRLACAYSHEPPELLLAEGREWLRRISALRDGRLTLTQHREILRLAGRVALLVGCVEYDIEDRRAAEATRLAALSLGKESGDSDTVGWAHEMRTWYALTQGQFRAALSAADAGLAAVGASHSVAVQLAAHQAKAWARIGDRRQVEVMLDRGRATLEALPYPDSLDNHFVIDPSKWDFYTMDCYRHVGEDRLADMYADEVIRSSTTPDGTVMKPMRVAEAHITKGVVAARLNDLEQALSEGRSALGSSRRSIPSLLLHTRELVDVLQDRFPDEPAVDAYCTEVQSLRRHQTKASSGWSG